MWKSTFRKNRILPPQDDMARFGVTEDQIAGKRRSGGWWNLMRFQIERARSMMLAGAPLAIRLAGRIGLEIPRRGQGGLRVTRSSSGNTENIFRRRRAARLGLAADARARAGDAVTLKNIAGKSCAQRLELSITRSCFCRPSAVRAITALYAFCGRSTTRWTTERWRRSPARLSPGGVPRSARLFSGDPPASGNAGARPRYRPFASRRRGLPRSLDGMEMDLNQSRYLNFSALRLYCHRVAGVVGALAGGHFRLPQREDAGVRRKAGLASSSPTSYRDVGEDARKNRIYLPMDELKEHG